MSFTLVPMEYQRYFCIPSYAFLYLISLLNFSLDPRVDLMSTILIVGGLILLKGVTAKRVYKNRLVDIMDTVIIYFNSVAFLWQHHRWLIV